MCNPKFSVRVISPFVGMLDIQFFDHIRVGEAQVEVMAPQKSLPKVKNSFMSTFKYNANLSLLYYIFVFFQEK